MAGYNPFAPFAEGNGKPVGAPQLPGVQAPNVAMQDSPGFMEKVAPAIAEKAMDSDMAGEAANYMKDGVKNAFSAFTKPSPAGGIPVTESIGAFTDSAMVNGMGSGITASAAPIAAGVDAGLASAAASMPANLALGAETLAATTAATTAAGTAAATGGAAAAAAGAAPLALMAGPFAPLVIGGAMLAAGK